MTRESIRQRLTRILAEQCNGQIAPQEEIADNTRLHGRGLGLSSLDIVSLVVKLEDEFNVFFEAEEVAPSVKTFGTLLEAIGRKVADGAAPPGGRQW